MIVFAGQFSHRTRTAPSSCAERVALLLIPDRYILDSGFWTGINYSGTLHFYNQIREFWFWFWRALRLVPDGGSDTPWDIP